MTSALQLSSWEIELHPVDPNTDLPEGTRVKFDTQGLQGLQGTIRGISAKFPYAVLYIVQLDEGQLLSYPYSCVVIPHGAMNVLD
jgi:hypothetical protein